MIKLVEYGIDHSIWILPFAETIGGMVISSLLVIHDALYSKYFYKKACKRFLFTFAHRLPFAIMSRLCSLYWNSTSYCHTKLWLFATKNRHRNITVQIFLYNSRDEFCCLDTFLGHTTPWRSAMIFRYDNQAMTYWSIKTYKIRVLWRILGNVTFSILLVRCLEPYGANIYRR